MKGVGAAMSVGIKNLAAVDATVMAWFAAVEKAAAEAAVGLAKEAFEQILETGPQNSGDFVANTNVSTGKPDFSFEATATPNPNVALFQMGDPAAQNAARAKANWTVPALGVPIFIASNAEHDEPYSVKIEEGKINLRPVNAGASHIYQRAKEFVQHRYTSIGKVQLAALRSKAK